MSRRFAAPNPYEAPEHHADCPTLDDEGGDASCTWAQRDLDRYEEEMERRVDRERERWA